MRRYLSAEQYRQLAEDEPSADKRHEQVDRGE